MTEHNTKKLLNLTATAAMTAAMTAAAGVAVTAGTAHADTNTDANQAPVQSQKQVTPQEQYQQASDKANDQISQQAQANATAEDQLAKQNDAANEADAKTTDEAVNKLQDQINQEAGPKKAQADADYAAKEKAVHQQVTDATKAENDNYTNAVAKQKAANKAAEDQMAKDNAQKLADAAKNITTPAQKDQLKDAAKATQNAGLTKAQTTKTNAEQAAKDALNQAKGNAQATHDQAVQAQKDTNAKRLADAQAAYQEAIKNAPKTGVTKATEPDGNSETDDGDLIYPTTVITNHADAPRAATVIEAHVPNNSIVHNINELDMSGKPGWIYYDPTTDTSEDIDINHLTLRQKEILNQYAVNELNALRNYFANNISKNKSIILTADGFSAIRQGNVHTLHTNDNFIKFLDDVSAYRANNDLGDFEHTTNFISTKSSMCGENIEQNTIKPTTLLQALVMIHNSIQGLAYGELYTDSITDSTINVSGHLQNTLVNQWQQAGVVFDHRGNILFEFSGNDPVGPDINTPEMAQILAAQSGQGTPDLNAPSVKAAAQHVEDVKNQNAQDLAKVENESLNDAGKDAYNAAMQKANDDYNAAVQQLQAAYDAEIKRINALPENNDELKASLNQQLVALKQDDQAKLDTLKKNHDAKLKQIKDDATKELADYKAKLQEEINNVDPEKAQQIKDLKAKHEAFVAANAQKLADLKAQDAAKLDALKAQLNGELSALHARLFPESSNGVVLSGGNTVVLPSNHVTTSESQQSANKTLPQTGNHEAVAGAMFGAMAALLGLSFISKKHFN